MNNYLLSCCSTIDLSEEHLAERNIQFTPFHFLLDGKSYDDDLGKTFPLHQFYQSMAEGAKTSTSQVNVEEYEAYFESLLEQGADVLHVCLSSGLSGSYRSALAAQEHLLQKYPDHKLIVVDSLGASSGTGLMMDKLADLRDGGASIDELAAWIEKNKLKMNYWFISTDLQYYVRGGRISKTSGTVGRILNICPLLNVDDKGNLYVQQKIRTKRRAMEALVAKMKECADDGLNYAEKCYISHSDCLDDANAVAAMVENAFPHLNGKVQVNWIGTTIGSHTGPGTIALFFWGKERESKVKDSDADQ